MRIAADGHGRSHRHVRSRARRTRFATASAASTLPLRLAIDRARRRAHVDLGRHSGRRSSPGTLSDWVALRFRPRRASTCAGLTRLLVHRDGRALLALHVADQPRSRDSRRCRSRIRPTTRPTSRSGSARTRRSASPRTPGRSTRASSTTGRSCSRPTTSIASARRCSSPRSIGCGAARLVCVFDATDRIQHMFWRYLDPAHPAGARPRHAGTATRSAICTSTTTRWSAA